MPYFERRAFLRVHSIAASSSIRTEFCWIKTANPFRRARSVRKDIA